MTTVRINTSDLEWLKRHGHGLEGPVAYGTDVRGVMYWTGPVEVPAVEHVKFAGASMIRFDLGPDAPRDHSRWAMYPDTYLVDEPQIGRVTRTGTYLTETGVESGTITYTRNSPEQAGLGEYITNDGDWLHCLCGNTPDMSGFVACLPDGTVTGPDADKWDGEHYVCADCGRIVSQNTLAVVGQRDPAGVIDEEICSDAQQA